MGRGRSAVIVSIAVVALVAVGCGNSKNESSSTTAASDSPTTTVNPGEKVPVNAPGVTDTEIRVGGVAAVTNPLGGKYGDAFKGVQAYFDKVNAGGGIYGRKLVLTEQRDDKVANNKAEVEALIANPNVFAVLPVATLLFTGADSLVQANMPTFGWTINPEWQGTPENKKLTLFGQTGSFLCLGCEAPGVPWVANKLGRKKVGILAYQVPQSSKCADGYEKSFSKYSPADGAKVVFRDSALSYGVTDLSVQVKKMKEAGVDLVVTCMDTNGVVTLAKEQAQQQLNAINYLPNGYDHEFVKEFGDLFEGSVVRTDFTQWELPADQQPQGLKDYLEWIEKAGAEPSENSMAAWINAATFVNGLRKAGPSFDRQKLVDAVNSASDFTADGLIRPVNWPSSHFERDGLLQFCDFISVIKDSKFSPEFTEAGKPFNCIDAKDPANLRQYYSA